MDMVNISGKRLWHIVNETTQSVHNILLLFGRCVYRRNGDVYRGYWSDNQKDGEGEFVADYGHGDRFVGTFHNDYKKKGKYEFSDGDVYEGEYEDDQQHGHGT